LSVIGLARIGRADELAGGLGRLPEIEDVNAVGLLVIVGITNLDLPFTALTVGKKSDPG
jgi:hypothetical protein